MATRWIFRTAALAIALCGAALVGYQAGAQDEAVKEPPKLTVNQVMRVGDEVITAEDLIARIWDYEFLLKPEERILTNSLTYLRDNVALVNIESARLGLTLTEEDVEAETKRQVVHWQNFVAQKYNGMLTWKDWLRQLQLTDEAFEKYLKERAPVVLKKRILVNYFEQTNQSIECSHILFGPNDLARAQQTYKTLQDTPKEKFADVFVDLAVQRSTEPGADITKGRLPRLYENDGKLVPEVATALWALKDGGFSEPVKTEYGYHILWRRQTIPAASSKPLSEMQAALISEPARQNDADRFNTWVRWVFNTQKYQVTRRLPGYDVPPNQP